MQTVYSLCGMCGARCPVAVSVEQGRAVWVQGNPHTASGAAICPRGLGALALEQDMERPLAPLVATGSVRGVGRWRETSWDEALDLVAFKLKQCIEQYGAESILLSHRSGLFADLYEAFARGLGTPNSFNHDVTCTRNAQQACQSVLGLNRGQLVTDYAASRHIVFQSRNVFESLSPAEVASVMRARSQGCRITVMDVRATVTAAHADDFFLMRPATDYAMNLAVLHVLIAERLYAPHIPEQMADFAALSAFVAPYTPQWGAEQTGIDAARIVTLARQLAEAAPKVIWYPGWFTARYRDSFLVSRSAYLINVLLGAVGERGGLPLGVSAKDVGRKGLNKLTSLYPKPEKLPVDASWQRTGLLHRAFRAAETGDPYPIRAYLSIRHNVLASLPDPDRLRRSFDALDFIAAITTTWSATASYADVVLPLSPPLSRESILAEMGGLRPRFLRRSRASSPRFNTKADWEILCGLAQRLGLEKLAFTDITALWEWQLAGTGVLLEDFDASGIVSLSETPQWKTLDAVRLATPSGKIEADSQQWQKAGKHTLAPYISPSLPDDAFAANSFRLIPGRIATHTQANTANNPLLADLTPSNEVWLHPDRAHALGIQQGDMVEMVSCTEPPVVGQIKAKVTTGIHPEAAFVVHGFGHQMPQESRAYGKGIADETFMSGGLELEDPLGGGLALQEHFVTIRRAP